MNFVCQQDSLDELHKLAELGRHSILIEGVAGSGKTYLAAEYAKMLGIEDFLVIEPTVQAIRDSIDACYRLDHPTMICIENIDTGVSAASYTLLKFLEEPSSHVYIVVTCRNINRVPDTIVSRSVCVTTNPPLVFDLASYAISKDAVKYTDLKGGCVWNSLRTFKDVDTVLHMTVQQLEYFTSLSSVLSFKDTISNLMWQLGHYPDNSETPIELVIRYLISSTEDSHVRDAGILCIKELSSSRIATHAVIAKFLFECKYIE